MVALARIVDALLGMPARPVFPESFYMVTRRCTQRQFLIRPSEEINNAFVYCLGEAAQRYGIDVILPSALSNHHHTVLFDRDGKINEFTEHFHKMFAKSQNCLFQRWENFWASEPVCNVKLMRRRDVLNKCLYAAINPVKDFLVDTVAHWPGVNGLYHLLNSRSLHAVRPRHFFSEHGTMPAKITLTLVLPPELGDPDEFRRELRALVDKVEHHFAQRRARTGRRVLGRQRLLRQSWRDSPTSKEPRRKLRPRFAARSKWVLVETLQRSRWWARAYNTARISWLAGKPTVFPAGTYWLRRFAGVTVAPLLF